ncbi:MAG: hypothetical protein AB1649_20995 [Chloroflexota bacterium]
MKKIGFCTHFTQTDSWAFDYALRLARSHNWQLTVCHWLNSPYNLRRDVVYSSLHEKANLQPVTPRLLTRLELELRMYYDPRLADFTQIGFKLCEGMYQVELVRCLRQNLLDLVIMGYQRSDEDTTSGEQPLEEFALHLPYPMVIVGPDSPNQFILNEAAQKWLNELGLPQGSWRSVSSAMVA